MRAKILLLSAIAAALQALSPVAAQTVQPNWMTPAQAQAPDRQRVRPLREVLDMLRSRYGGEYVSHRVEDGERPIYVIRWRMPDGITTRDFRVDAISGQLR